MKNMALPRHIFFISYVLNFYLLGYIKKAKRKLHLPATASVCKFFLSRAPCGGFTDVWVPIDVLETLQEVS